jgi:L-alanine-DL-glutamate epimerase-like enolase superfamily enzyme
LPALEEELPRLLGRSPFEFYQEGIGVVGVSAAEFAVWDLVAKAQERPVYALLAGSGREVSKVFSSFPLTGRTEWRYNIMGVSGGM